MPCCHLGASIVSSIHSGSDGSSIATPMLANVIEPAYITQSEYRSAIRFSAQLAELIVYNRSQAVCLSVCVLTTVAEIVTATLVILLINCDHIKTPLTWFISYVLPADSHCPWAA